MLDGRVAVDSSKALAGETKRESSFWCPLIASGPDGIDSREFITCSIALTQGHCQASFASTHAAQVRWPQASLPNSAAGKDVTSKRGRPHLEATLTVSPKRQYRGFMLPHHAGHHAARVDAAADVDVALPNRGEQRPQMRGL